MAAKRLVRRMRGAERDAIVRNPAALGLRLTGRDERTGRKKEEKKEEEKEGHGVACPYELDRTGGGARGGGLFFLAEEGGHAVVQLGASA